MTNLWLDDDYNIYNNEKERKSIVMWFYVCVELHGRYVAFSAIALALQSHDASICLVVCCLRCSRCWCESVQRYVWVFPVHNH